MELAASILVDLSLALRWGDAPLAACKACVIISRVLRP